MPLKFKLSRESRYFIKHYEGLTQFCHIPGAQIDNNCMEAEIKLIVRDRKNGLFRKTLFGACVGDIITSMIATSSWCGANIFEYFNLLQRDKLKVKTHPELYLPWNYQTQR